MGAGRKSEAVRQVSPKPGPPWLVRYLPGADVAGRNHSDRRLERNGSICYLRQPYRQGMQRHLYLLISPSAPLALKTP